MILFFPHIVEAKTLENTCVYNASYEKKGETKNFTITCKFYDNSTYDKCNIGTTFSQSIDNWKKPSPNYDTLKFSQDDNAKTWYTNNHSCLPYIIIFDRDKWANNYQLYAAVDLTRANSIVKYAKDLSYYTAIGYPQGTSGETTDPYALQKETIESYTEILNDVAKNFGLENCMVDGKIDYNVNKTSYANCFNKINTMYKQIDEYDAYVKEQIDNGVFSENDQIIKDYRAAVKSAKGNVNEDVNKDFSGNSGTISADDAAGATTEDETDGTSNTDCNTIFGGKFGELLKDILSLLRFAVPILIIGLSVVDFIKAVAAQDQNEIKKAANKFAKRLVIGVLIFLLPTILDLILDLAGVEYGTCGIR
jgi:hypothetical protein